ncbi:MAG: hypothetical protein M1814_005224 [Vezdaea aestivalis]|nr:MAG: hypothetical protein M1814_005224 [Vezdaea aestivalis]
MAPSRPPTPPVHNPSSQDLTPISNSQPPPSSTPDLSILSDDITIHPGGYVEPAPPEPPTPTLDSTQSSFYDNNLTEPSPSSPNTNSLSTDEKLLGQSPSRFRAAPFDFLREIQLHVSGVSWRAYDKPIGQPIYYNGFTEKMKNEVLENDGLKKKISELANTRAEEERRIGMSTDRGRAMEIEGQLMEVAERMTDQMICKFESKRFIRGAAYLCTQLVTRAYNQGIHVSSSEVLRLKSIAAEATRTKQSLIFLPCHRSHVDYVSLQLICFRLGLALPTVVAGDNLNFPVVGKFLQNAGAMWIRRSFGNDALYTTLVQAYIDALLKGGFNFECFIDSVLSGRVQDTIICPVSTQYDKVIETEGYVAELLGTPKKKENLLDFLSASSVLSLKLGRVDVRFHEPWSLRTFINQQMLRFTDLRAENALKPLSDADIRTRLLRTLGYRVLADINAVSVVMPTALVGTVLLTLRGRGVGALELSRRVDWLSDRVRAQGGRVAHFGGAPTALVVERALEVLGPELVGIIDDLSERIFYAVDRFQLSFYRNMTIHLFVSEALVSAGMYMQVKQGGGPENQRISWRGLRDQVGFLSQLFRGEFIFPPMGLLVNLNRTLRGLASDDVIRLNYVDESESEIDTIELSASERNCGRENYDFYCFLIWPFIEASWLGAVALMGLTPPLGSSTETWLDAKMVQGKAQLLGKTLYHQGDLSYFEAVNKEVLANAFSRFTSEGILQTSTFKGTASQIRLAPGWTPSRVAETQAIKGEGRLWDWCERIAKCRREGKNRRDGATVSTRVLYLADKIGGELFEAAAAAVEPIPSNPSAEPFLKPRL